MNKSRIIVIGIGPGSPADITQAAITAIQSAQVVVGYQYYFQFIEAYLSPDTICIDSGMKKERERAEEAFNYALQGNCVAVISSGDAGIYGMAPLIYEMKRIRQADIEIEVLPGISAFQKAASLLGAPIGHDLCIISLSDLMTPWLLIEKRIKAAAMADFVTAIYNPKSKGRYWQLYRLQELMLEERDPATPVGIVRQAGRADEQVEISTLGGFDPETVDMFTVLIIGNSQSYEHDGCIITPRGYYREEEIEAKNLGQEIMIKSFRNIDAELERKDYPLDHKWALLHAIHTTADFEMEQLLYSDEKAVQRIHEALTNGSCKQIITDVNMARTGIRQAALERLGVQTLCYLSDERVAEMAQAKGITRTQAGIRLAVQDHPEGALFVFGNAPTALMELAQLVRKGQAKPSGIIAAPVGFVHVQESKHMVKPFKEIPKLIVEGRKGGSNLAATLVNAILSLDDAEQLKPGRDV